MTAGFGHVEDRLSAFLDDELSDAAALSVTRHLARCRRCRVELERLRRTRAALRRLAAPVEVELPPPAVATSRRGGWVALGLVAALGVLGVVLVLTGAPSGGIDPPVDSYVVDHVGSTGGGPVVTPVQLDP